MFLDFLSLREASSEGSMIKEDAVKKLDHHCSGLQFF